MQRSNIGQRSQFVIKHPKNKSAKISSPSNVKYNIPSVDSLINKAYSYKKSINFSDCYSFSSQNESLTQLAEMEKDREYLLLRNIELENEIKKLDQMIINSDKDNTNNNNKSKTIEKKERIRKKKPSVSEENNQLRQKIKTLQNSINKLQAKRKKNQSNNTIRKEIMLWKERQNELTENYIKTLKELKEELRKDKLSYKQTIQNIKRKFTKDVEKMNMNYKSVITNNDQKLEYLFKENEELKRKEEKLKEIYMYNFN